MPKFPNKENDALVLVNTMITGYTAHALDFPSADILGLTAVRDAFVAAYDAHVAAAAAAKAATETKNTALTALTKTAANEIKKSEADCVDSPSNLEYIGWGPRKEPTPTPIPGQVLSLDIDFQGDGTVDLSWKTPPNGGTIRSYVIERRMPDDPDHYSWEQAGMAIEKEANLTGQPTGVKLEYHAKAINATGEGQESNTVVCVL